MKLAWMTCLLVGLGGLSISCDSESSNTEDIAPVDASSDSTPDVANACAPPSAYAQDIDVEGTLYYVNPTCEAGGNGSLERPFLTLTAALDVAVGGDAILAAEATYDEQLFIDEGPLLIAGPDNGLATLTPSNPVDTAVIEVAGARGIILQHVGVENVSPLGVWVYTGELTMTACSVAGITAGDGLGVGVLASDGATLSVINSTITQSESAGVFFRESKGSVEGSTLEANGYGGIRLELTSDAVTLDGNTLRDNKLVGIGVFGSKSIILQNDIEGTQALANVDSGDGIIASQLKASDGTTLGDAEVDIRGSNTVCNNARVGILMGEGSRGIILQNEIAGNEGAGIWLQANAGASEPISIESNTVSNNTYTGIGVATGARSIILQNDIDQTQLGSQFQGLETVELGDGIGVFAGASANIEGNALSANLRNGIITDSADGANTAITGNTVAGSGSKGIILQNQGGNAPLFSNNTLSNNVGGDAVDLIPVGEATQPIMNEATQGFGNPNTSIILQ